MACRDPREIPVYTYREAARCFDIYATFDGTRNYRKFPDALSSRIFLEQLGRGVGATMPLQPVHGPLASASWHSA